MFREIIEEEFDKFIKETYSDKDGIKNFLLNHERRPLLFKNLETELKKADYKIFGLSGDLKKKRDTIRMLSKDFAKTFCMAALEHKEKQIRGSEKKLILV